MAEKETPRHPPTPRQSGCRILVACSAALGIVAGSLRGPSHPADPPQTSTALPKTQAPAAPVDPETDIRTLLVTRESLSREFWQNFAGHQSRFVEAFRNELSVRALKFGLGSILNEQGCIAAYHDLASLDPALAAWVTSTRPPPSPTFLSGAGNEPLESLFIRWTPKVLDGFIRAVANQPEASAWAHEIFRQLYRGPGARSISASSAHFLTQHIGADKMLYIRLTMEPPDAHDDAVLKAIAGGGTGLSPDFIGWVISQMASTRCAPDLMSQALAKHPDARLHALRMLWIKDPDRLPDLLQRIPGGLPVTPTPAAMETPSYLAKRRLDAMLPHLKPETPAAFVQWVGNALMQGTGDIRQVVQMASRFPDGLRKTLLASSMAAFAERCPFQASQFLEGMPDSRDKLFLAESFAANSPDALIKEAWNRESARLRAKHP